MNPFTYKWRASILCLLSVCTSCIAWAQTAVFSANASASKIGVQDQVQVDYTVQDVEDLRSITKPAFKDFDVIGGPYQRSSNNISIVGNRMVQSASITHSYILQPKKTGTLTIPPAIARDAAGHSYESNALTLQVVNGSLARQNMQAQDPFGDPFGDPFAALKQRRQALANKQQQQQQQPATQAADMKDIYKNLFIKVTVDKNKAYVGEQITASYKLYARIPMNMGISKLPSLNGFWTQDFEIPKGNVKPVEETINGQKYQVFLLKKSALFPQQTGTLTLDPAEAEGNARIVTQVRQRNPFGGMFDNDPFFQQAFGSLMMSDPFFNDDFFSSMAYKDVPVKLRSTPVKITVLPLPEAGKPENYGNAVGNFTVNGKIDKTSLSTDDALTYTLTISGSGNIKLIEAPVLKLPNGLSTYDPQVIDTITGRSTTISGSKIVTYAISANIPGDYTIPAIPFSYYNPQTGSYVTLETQPVTIHVTKGKHYNPSLARAKTLGDIHPIVSKAPSSWKVASKPLFFTATYWSMYALPLLAFIGMAAYKRREEVLSRDTIKLRNRRANRIALKRLSNARKLLQQNAKQPFYEEVSKAIWLYLSDKLNIPLSSLSKERAFDELNSKNVSPALLDRAERTFLECETALYSPHAGAHQMQHTFNEAVDIISKLEESI